MEFTGEHYFYSACDIRHFVNKTNAHMLLLQTRLWLTATNTSSPPNQVPNAHMLLPKPGYG